jgi:hypothetical protein
MERYPTLLEKAAVLLERNHPLPDGNKRTAFIVTGLFLEAYRGGHARRCPSLAAGPRRLATPASATRGVG